MSPRVSISRKAAQRIESALTVMVGDAVHPYRDDDGPAMALSDIRAALAPKPKSSARKKTETKRRKKGAETKAIREAVMARADDCCECGCGRGVDEMDHQWGRGRIRQTVQNCWGLFAGCHFNKTNNRPSRLYWLERFRVHANRHGYTEEAAKAARYVQTEQALDLAESVGCP